MTGPKDALRRQGLLGARSLAGREIGGIVTRIAGTLLLTRALGPRDFGVYAGSVAVMVFLTSLAQLSVEVWIIRADEPPSARVLQTLTAILLVGSAAVVLCIGAAVVALAALMGRPAWAGPFLIVLLALPVAVLWGPAQGLLERELRFPALSRLELAGDLVLYATSVGLVLMGLGVYGAAAGYVLWQLFLLIASWRAAKMPRGLAWDSRTVRDLPRFGLLSGAGGWTSRLQDLVNPVVVGAFAGASTVGVVALGLRIVQTLGFINRVAYRLSYPLLARLRDSPPRLVRALENGAQLQVLGTALPLAGFALVAPQLVPLAFGEQWLSVLPALPLLSLAAVAYAGLQLPGSALILLGAHRSVMAAALARAAVLLLVAALLLRPYGVVGYSVAAVAAVLPYLALRRRLTRLLRGPDGAAVRLRYRPLVPWLVATGPVLAAPVVPARCIALLLLPAATVALHRPTRQQLKDLLAELRDSAPSGTAATTGRVS